MQVTRILDSIVLFRGYPVTLGPDQTRLCTSVYLAGTEPVDLCAWR